MALSNFEKKQRLDKCYGGTNYTVAANHYIGLFSAAPNAGGGGTEAVIGTNAYARCAVVNNTTNWPASTLGSPKTNGAVFTFPAPTGAWASGNPLTHFAIFDAATGGNMIEFGELVTPITINGAGGAPSIPIGDLVLESL